MAKTYRDLLKMGRNLGRSAHMDSFGHSYFRDSPAVSSDLIIMLRDDAEPGGPERPLQRLGKYFWRVPA